MFHLRHARGRLSVTTSSSYSGVSNPVFGLMNVGARSLRRWLQSSACPPQRTTKGLVVHCPYCRHSDSRVLDSREADEGRAIRRRRSCAACGRRFTTMEEAILVVVKRSGVREPFSRTKIEAGVRKACQGRPANDDAIAALAQSVEEAIRPRESLKSPATTWGWRSWARCATLTRSLTCVSRACTRTSSLWPISNVRSRRWP